MGSVYRARDMHFPNIVKLVAVKEMINAAPDPIVRQSIVQNFEREANILATLSHPAIPKIFDYFTHEERSYLVLEYVHGKDLEAILGEASGFFAEDQVIAWAIEILDLLQFLHTHKPEPIIFRDMKPSNVMINQSNHVVMVDFGIAKVFREGQRGTMVGTEGYSPPEQYRGEATTQADLYALGATMHHLLTRRDPRLETPFTFSERPIRQINNAVSLDLEAVINTALMYNPNDRFASAQAMKDALLSVARKTGALERVDIRTSRMPGIESGLKPKWVYSCEDEIRGSAACENNVVYVGALDNNLYAVAADSGEFLWKYPTSGGVVGCPAVADGIVYIGSEDGYLYALAAKSGQLLWNYQAEGPIRSSPRVAEGHVFFGSDDRHMYAVNITAARRLWRIETGGQIRSSPFIAKDYLYFGNDEGEFHCLDFRGQVKWKFNTKRGIISSPLVSHDTVYFCSLDSQLYALDARSGWAIWRFRMGKGSISSPCRSDSMVITGSADGNIYCVDAGSSREAWRFKTDHQVSGSPVVHGDAVYCGSADGNVYCLELRSGRLRWKYATGGPITAAPVVYNDTLYIGSTDHQLYAFAL
jgi:outer membrane protein assembly factor BamB/tRNA A-37 threonylcarbamoyl transferase component Bud32